MLTIGCTPCIKVHWFTVFKCLIQTWNMDAWLLWKPCVFPIEVCVAWHGNKDTIETSRNSHLPPRPCRCNRRAPMQPASWGTGLSSCWSMRRTSRSWQPTGAAHRSSSQSSEVQGTWSPGTTRDAWFQNKKHYRVGDLWVCFSWNHILLDRELILQKHGSQCVFLVRHRFGMVNESPHQPHKSSIQIGGIQIHANYHSSMSCMSKHINVGFIHTHSWLLRLVACHHCDGVLVFTPVFFLSC